MNHKSFKQDRVWITGASSGIGAALAKAFAEKGARVALTAQDSERERLEAVRQQCANPDQHIVVPLDLTMPDAIAPAVDAVKKAFDGIDILVNNAGQTHRSAILESDMALYRRIMEINFFAPVALCKAVLPDMLADSGGHIINIASVNGLFATRRNAAYCASKHALAGWSESLRAEIGDGNVDLTVIYPGFVKTDISVNALAADGTRHGKQGGHAQGLDPDAVAKQVLDAAARRKPRLLVGGKERWLVHLQKISPSLVTKIVRRVGVD